MIGAPRRPSAAAADRRHPPNSFGATLAMSLPFDLRFLAVPAIVCAMGAPALAQEQTLKVGMDAPEFTVGSWIQGEIDGISDPSKTYIVEFWATWCGPCMRSIPHLNKLHQRFRGAGLVIIGISDESASTVKPFVARKGNSMSYPVAIDTQDKTMNTKWMKAANQPGIPSAFIVRGGKILWIGNPLDPKFDLVVTLSLIGRYNPELFRKAEPMLEAASDALKLRNFRDAYRHYDDILKIDQSIFGSIACMKYESMIHDAKDAAGARAWGEEMLTRYSTDWVTLLEFSNTILKSDKIRERDFDLASKVVERLVALVPSGNMGAKRMQAELAASQGRFEEAQEFQYEAWLAASPEDKADQRKLLDEYRRAARAKPSARVKEEAPAAEGATEPATEGSGASR
ncbi:MAG: redoxin domain-containing protein [Phycisphaera sp.]|nr:redoxin domain-containing protein [Phycisphaera sp.]